MRLIGASPEWCTRSGSGSEQKDWEEASGRGLGGWLGKERTNLGRTRWKRFAISEVLRFGKFEVSFQDSAMNVELV